MITNLQKLGVDTSGEKSMSLTYSDDVRKNYQSLFRLLRRLTKNYTFKSKEFANLLARMNQWEPKLSLTGKYRLLNKQDNATVKKAVGFTDKMTEEQVVVNKSCVVILYNGTTFRNQHIWSGTFRRPMSLSNGAQVKSLLLISKPAAILLNWSLQGQILEDFDVLASYMVNKMSERYTLIHNGPLTRIFHQFYTDYLARYSVTLQTQEYEAMRKGSVATAYRTKKNIPEHIQSRMDSTSLLQLFDFVELDESVDLELFDRFEHEVSQLKLAMPAPFNYKVASLRLRKLGKHSSVNKTTTGLYYPTLDNIVVELRDVSSFMHEWGHAIDNKLDTLSGQRDFLDGIYSTAVSYIAKHVENKQFQSYYSMPNEVFARAFEWYMDRQYGGMVGILKTRKCYQNKPEYKCFKPIESQVMTYFDSLFR